MTTQSIVTAVSQVGINLEGSLAREYHAQEILFQAQLIRVQRMLELQAQLISKAIVEHRSPLLFTLPDQVVQSAEENYGRVLVNVPQHLREQKVGGLMDLLKPSDLERYLKGLESSPEKAISTCGKLFRHAIARHLVTRMLPVPQRIGDQRRIPPYALQFFMPQWVAFDQQDNLLVNSLEEARTCVAEMQHYLAILNMAERFAPYIVEDGEYQRKHAPLLAQLIDQGQALARYETCGIILAIQRRVNENSLNRGFSLSLPFFDDQVLEMKTLEIDVVPRGRIQFVPAFVVITAHLKGLEVAHSPGFNPSTREHLLQELQSLEKAFDTIGSF